MPKINEAFQSFFLEIRLQFLKYSLYGTSYDVASDCAVLKSIVLKFLSMRFEQFKKLLILYHPHLNDFRRTITYMTPGQCFQKSDIKKNGKRYVIIAKTTLVTIKIHPYFNPYARVHQ